MLEQAICLFGIAIGLIFGLWNLAPQGWPKMPRWAVVTGIFVGVLFVGITIGLLIGDLRRTLSVFASPQQIRRLLDDFERHAAEEHYMATAMRIEIPYLPYDKQGVPRRSQLVNEDQRRDWREYLVALRRDCDVLGLRVTSSAINSALSSFNDTYSDANLSTSWSAYNYVSATLKDEIGRRGLLSTAKEGP